MFEVQHSLSLLDFKATLMTVDLKIICFKLWQQVLPMVQPQVQLKIFNSHATVHDPDPTSQKAMTNPKIAQAAQKTKNMQHFQEAETKLQCRRNRGSPHFSGNCCCNLRQWCRSKKIFFVMPPQIQFPLYGGELLLQQCEAGSTIESIKG